MAESDESNILKSPKTLYRQCLSTYVINLNHKVVDNDRRNILHLLPPIVLADIYYEVALSQRLNDILMEELSDLQVFSRLLRFSTSRQKMFCCFSVLMEFNKPIASELKTTYREAANAYIVNVLYVGNSSSSSSSSCTNQTSSAKDLKQLIDTGLRLGTFLAEAGWIEDSLHVLTDVNSLIQILEKDYSSKLLQLDCLQRLLHAQAHFCCFKEAAQTTNLALSLITVEDKIPNSLLANLFMQISVLHFLRSEYDSSYSWSIRALKKINHSTPDKIAIDVLRQVAKSCVIKRQFKRANMLVCQAVKRARDVFGVNHQKHADTLLDYGFFLLNVDSITESVKIYKEALEMRKNIFGHRNLHVALAHEDLAYALYVFEYSSGQFQKAGEHVETAIEIMKGLVPYHHLMLASAKRVKALILEEIALDNAPAKHPDLLQESEKLHRSALQLSLEAFGEINVQTAKHYGNLGRLYQSMQKFEDAEKMHQRAIKIKTDLLGAYDYEVGLSIGHLASLYNYHMKKHREAEELYLKSININLKLFGNTYSGLEYDYRGLCYVYESLHEAEKYLEFSRILDTWKTLRETNEPRRNVSFIDFKEDAPVEEVTQKFFDMCKETEGILAK